MDEREQALGVSSDDLPQRHAGRGVIHREPTQGPEHGSREEAELHIRWAGDQCSEGAERVGDLAAPIVNKGHNALLGRRPILGCQA
ncbi:MAG TPA: hypothetical protein VFU22_14545 [Roseiflexaceae bacterium]|nr:hypothetical protein [Roseiflexaceae bacterium]